MVDIALFQPEIPHNTATLIRTAACLGFAVHIIEPAGFHWSDRGLRRAGLDYLDLATVIRHAGFGPFAEAIAGRRLVLATTRAATAYTDFAFHRSDMLLFGSESAGVPPAIHAAACHRLTIPMQPGRRSLNLAVAAAMVTAEALRQTCGAFPNSAVSGNEPP
jgi:tRNA (cytidine/uridine-2'-O-)-methyltransferase